MLRSSQIRQTGEFIMRRFFVLTCSIVLFANVGNVSGATITVTTTEPGISADGLCSFAEAVENVRDGDGHSDCEAGSDGLNIIELGQGETYLQGEGVGYAFGGVGELTLIRGNGSTFDAIDEEDGWTGFIIFGDAIINDLTIAGSVSGQGAIWAFLGRLSLNRCTVRDNDFGLVAEAEVVFITNTSFVSNQYGISGYDATLIATNSDFLSNYDVAIQLDWDSSVTLNKGTVEDNHRGIAAHEVDIRYSTIKNNDDFGVMAKSGSITGSTIAWNGDGVILWDDGYGPNRFTVMSSTITGNTRSGFSGQGFFHHWPGIALIRDSTIIGNDTGLYGSPDQYEIKNSILSSNGRNCRGSTWLWNSSSRGFNLTDDNYCDLSGHADTVVADVMLSELGDWGGSTPSHMPLEGSPAIDMVEWASQCSSRDQRGYLRPADGDGNGVAHCDCGAVEYNSYPPPVSFEPDFGAALNR
jgi:hypothetical protein